jgi:hypothetical protein
MGDIKAGVSREKCVKFEEFASRFPDVTNSFSYKYFIETYKLICDSQIDKFLDISFDYLAKANSKEKISIQKYSYRIAISSGNKESLINHYETYISKLTDPAELKEIEEYVGRMRGPVPQK